MTAHSVELGSFATCLEYLAIPGKVMVIARPRTWSLVVPVKLLARAKSRLAATAGPHRERLALAVAADTVAAALRCPRVETVLVVTDDRVAGPELAALGAYVVPDEPDSGLNPALVYGAARARALAPGHGIGALSADLPALRPEELTKVLDAADGPPWAFVPDASGSGTTLYTARPGVAFQPAFGPGSRGRHRATGAHEIALDGTASVRRDVDTLSDLLEALTLGVGRHTSAVAEVLPATRLRRLEA